MTDQIWNLYCLVDRQVFVEKSRFSFSAWATSTDLMFMLDTGWTWINTFQWTFVWRKTFHSGFWKVTLFDCLPKWGNNWSRNQIRDVVLDRNTKPNMWRNYIGLAVLKSSSSTLALVPCKYGCVLYSHHIGQQPASEIWDGWPSPSPQTIKGVHKKFCVTTQKYGKHLRLRAGVEESNFMSILNHNIRRERSFHSLKKINNILWRPSQQANVNCKLHIVYAS